jgi:hypothetical protein
VATHAIGQQKKAGTPGVAVTHPVFVFFASAAPANLEYRKFHAGSFISF